MQEWFEKNKNSIMNYAIALDPKLLRDVTRSAARSINSINKEQVVGYLKRPNSYEKQIRNTSWYLTTRSQIYQRIIMHYATMPCFDARSIVPNYDFTKTNNSDKKILKSYYDTANLLRAWNINNEFLKVTSTCFIQDVSYNVVYADETGLFLLPLPADHCRILAQFPTGDFQFAFNMQYFSANQNYLEYWGSPFTQMYEASQNGSNWQIVPQEYSACFKFRSYDWSSIIPPFSGIFGNLIDLLDAENVEAISQQQDIFKLIYVKLKTLSNTNEPDAWQINPDTVVEYFDRMCNEALPEYTAATVVPSNDDLGVIDFSSNEKTAQTNRILNATKNVLNASGGAQVLNSATISGSTAYKYSIISDGEFALSILPQIEGWFNRIVATKISNPSKIKFMHVTKFTREDYRKEMLEDAQNSLPTKLSILALNGYDPIDVMSLNHLEEDILHLSDKFVNPLNTSYTKTGDNTKDESEMTDDGIESRDKETN